MSFSIPPPQAAAAAARAPPPPPSPSDAPILRHPRRHNISPTPKLLHRLRKKQTLKSLRRAKTPTPPAPASHLESLAHQSHYRTIAAEYQTVKAALAGRPWEGSDGDAVKMVVKGSEGGGGGRLKGEYLEELRAVLEERKGRVGWLMDDDVEEEGEGSVARWEERRKEKVGDAEKIQLLVKRLSSTNLDMHDWQFSRLMKQSDLLFSEPYLLKIADGLGAIGDWRHALSVVEWVYNDKAYTHRKSRFVYTKLLSVLGKARRPSEALQIFNIMREDAQIYPDMAAYHNIAVTLGQAGLVKELTSIVECMRQKPSKKLKNAKSRNWDPCLEPDVIIYNAVLNACVPSHQWKGVPWVLGQMRFRGLRPTGATYGLAMEVMLQVGKYDLVYKFFEKMLKGGLTPKALTYKVLVRAFWREGKIDEAVKAVRDMEQRGVVGISSVYYELACCLCNHGRWQDAMLEVRKLKRLRLSKPLQVTFTGMILSSLDGGHIPDCISVFEHMKENCIPDTGTINAMLKVYCRSDMFANAKDLFESTKAAVPGLTSKLDNSTSFKPDIYSYTSMLEVSASAQQWDYFEYVYKEMALCGCQLDQKKHTRLLVEASRSGKGHLLEHAFDTILEAGEIPHLSVFTELFCQAIAQEEFERTIPLINSMASASMQASEGQWTNLFQRNKARFSEDKLRNLLNYLASGNLVSEDPVPSLLTSLQSICGQEVSEDILPLAATSDVLAENTKFGESDNFGESSRNKRSLLPRRNSVGDTGSLHLSADDPIFLVDNISTCYEYLSDQAGNVAPTEIEEQEKPTCAPDGCTAEAIELLAHDIVDSFSKLPSAAEILESWRGDKLNDNTFQH